MTLKARIIPCLDIKDGRHHLARRSKAARTGIQKYDATGDMS